MTLLTNSLNLFIGNDIMFINIPFLEVSSWILHQTEQLLLTKKILHL